MTNYTTTKGPGDFDAPCTKEPTDAEIISCTKNNAKAVAKNSLEFNEMLMQALIEYYAHGTTDGLDLLANASAEDLLYRGEV